MLLVTTPSTCATLARSLNVRRSPRWVKRLLRPIARPTIPSMKMVRHQQGHSVAVFDPDRWARRELQDKVYNGL